ncbi:MAG: O-antigen ligase family protein [Thiotrichales bacterium]|nr:O-antigen ligase family protein [Thiotrichales bacterium]
MAKGWSDIEQFFAGNIHTSWGYRLEMWRIVLLGFVEHPLLGHGLDAFNAYTVALSQAGVTQLPNGFGSPHNEYLHMLFSVGIVGLLLFLALLIGLLVLLFKAVGGVNNIRRSLYAVLYFALVIYIAMTCFFDTSWSNKHLIYVYVIILTASAFVLQKDFKFKKVKDN